jgi:phosphotransferase system enzyme I (PtsI)
MSDSITKQTTLKGIGGSPGICIGKAYLVDKEGVDVIGRYRIADETLQDEKNRFKIAVKKAEEELRAIIDDTSEEFRQYAGILETHVVLLKDKMLYGRTIETIEKERVNAEWALKTVVLNIKSMFSDISDGYLKERGADILQVSDRIMRNLVGAETENIADINKRVILIAHDLSPAETTQINLEKIMGFVTARGGRASHTAIIARSLEIPAVLGLGQATSKIKTDDLIILDGSAGIVILNPTEKTLVKYEERKILFEEYRANVIRESHQPAETADGFGIQVMGNIELPREIVPLNDNGGEGIGLYRTEFQYLNRKDFPSENELFDNYKAVVEVIAPRPVTFRTLDINGDKAIDPDSEEINPALGLRGLRYCLKNTDLFKTQLRAILRAAAFGNVRVMFPMISCLEEVFEAKKILKEAAESLAKEGVEFNDAIEVGVLIEVPSAVITADLMAEAVDFFSIGTNDLIQYSLAIDRVNTDVAHLYQALHPAIIRMLKRVADVAKGKGIKVLMCGEMAGDPFNIPLLLGLGIDELSMNPQSIPIVKRIIRSVTIADARRFVKDVLKLTVAEDIVKHVQNVYGDVFSKNMYKD